MTSTARLNLPLIDAGQAQKNITHNEAILALDQFVQASVLSQTLTAPPTTNTEGDSYIVAASATGAWTGKTGQIAAWQQGVWNFYAPAVGCLVWVGAQARMFVWTGAAWVDVFNLFSSTLQNMQLLGVGTTATASNPLAAKLNAALFTALAASEGGSGDLRLSLNKSTASNTVSQLYQDGYSGRAETGLCGDDHFHIKVSPDGAVWRDAVNIDPATGLATLLQLALSNALSVASGGTGASTAAGALANLGAAPAQSPSFTGVANFANTPTIGGTALSSLYALVNAWAVFSSGVISIGNGSTAANIYMNAVSGQFGVITWQTAGLNRWAVFKDTAENFGLNYYADDGSYRGQSVSISRSTGAVNFLQTPQINGAALSSIYAPQASPAFTGTVKVPAYTVATLPVAGTAGRTVHCSNARMFNGAGTLESSGAGTGGLLIDNGSAWKIAGTNVTASS